MGWDESDYPAIERRLEHYRSVFASADSLPRMEVIAGQLLGALIEAWPNLSPYQRDAVASSVAVVELAAGGNLAYSIAEGVEEQAREALERISRRADRG